MNENLIERYLRFTDNTEVPVRFRRWAIVSGIGAYLGRDIYLDHGHFRIHPNMFCMLMGSPGTRKSTAVKLVKDILLRAGYIGVAADKISKEKFLNDLSDMAQKSDDSFHLSFSEEDLDEVPPVNCFIMADEFNDFFATDAIGFLSMLANLWDYSGVYHARTKNGENLGIPNPTISILGGNTPTNFALAFPPEALGQGFLSRTILIHGEPNGKRIAFPPEPDLVELNNLVENLRQVKYNYNGKIEIEPDAKQFLEDVYCNYEPISDVRFESYANRRFNHLLKLCLITTAARLGTSITKDDVLYANTMLSGAEMVMPKALGEYGKSRNSDVTHKVIQILSDNSHHVMTMSQIWTRIHTDLEKMRDLQEIMQNLIIAGRVAPAGNGFTIVDNPTHTSGKNSKYIDLSLLTLEEQ